MKAQSDQHRGQEPSSRRRLLRRPSLAAQTEQILGERLQSNEFSPGDRLPAENELAEEYGVSRATIRTAIGVLARRGLVVQRQGVGTFAAAGARVTNDLAQATDLGELVRRHGPGSDIAFDHVAITTAPPEVANALDLPSDASIVQSTKRFLRGKETLVYVVNSIPVPLVGPDLAQRMVTEPSIIEPLFEFLEGEVGERPGPQLARIFPELGADIRHPANTVAADLPVLRIEEIGYSETNRPLWHSQTWFPAGSMNMELIRQPPNTFF